MKKLFIILALAMFLPVSTLRAADNYIDKMGDLVEEISLLNVLRGIYLNEQQARRIAELAAEAEKLRSAARAEVEKLAALPAFSQLRDELYTALAENPPAVRAKVVELDNQAHQITGAVLHKIALMEDEIKTMLSHGQQNIFWSFVPCIVPEVDFENPVRTGQAAASSRLMPACELIRNTSEEMWKKHGQAYLDHILKVIEQDAGKMTEDAREDLRRRLVKHAWKIRKMKEADYMINRDKLAEELLLINREHTMRSGFRITGKLARFFLSPAAARVMPKWIETHFSSGNASGSVVPAASIEPDKSADDKNVAPAADQSMAPADADVDREFWEKLVPESLARLSETPYYDHILHAYGKPLSRSLFDEENKYVETLKLLKEASVILTRDGDLKYYTLTQGEP
ncbi:MAG TPA: hypothetical protein PLK58_15585 [Candidatus Rifleibacterium sp.]|nr:hypothetical protein [Candidatus Rifleibacterium sp.]